MPEIFTVVIVLMVGAIIGSFLSVCIYRLPFGSLEAENLSQSEPVSFNQPSRSICPKCRKQLYWWHNFPVISWFLLSGRCFFCKEPIQFRYPFVELLAAFIALLSYSTFDISPTGILVFCFCSALLVITFIDYEHYIIPNVISLPGIVIGLVIGLVNGWLNIFTAPVVEDVISSVLGILVGGGTLYVVGALYLWLRKLEGLGMGDIKLLAMTGAFFGPECALFTMFIGSLLGSVIGLVIILLSGKGLKHHLPFGPYLGFATFFYLLGRDNIFLLLEFFGWISG